MRFNELMNVLISISGMSKSEFAAEIKYTPSAISKILTKGELPSEKTMRKIILNSVRTLTDSIYDKNLIHQLENVFPLTLQFNNKQEVFVFIKQALDLAYAVSIEDGHQHETTTPKGQCYWEKRDVWTQLILRLSFAMLKEKEPLVLYCTADVFGRADMDFFRQVKFNPGAKCPKIILRQSVQEKDFTAQQLFKTLDVFDMLCDIVEPELYLVKENIPNYEWIFMEKHLLCVYAFIMPESPILNFINESQYLLLIRNFLLSFFTQPISLRGKQLEEKLAELDEKKLEEIAGEINYLLSYVPLGLLLTEEDLDKNHPKYHLMKKITYFYHCMLNKGLKLIFPHDAPRRFFENGQVKIPIAKACVVEGERMRSYIDRYFFKTTSNVKKYAINDGKNHLALLVSPSAYYLYASGNAYNDEKLVRIELDTSGFSEALSNNQVIEY